MSLVYKQFALSITQMCTEIKSIDFEIRGCSKKKRICDKSKRRTREKLKITLFRITSLIALNL